MINDYSQTVFVGAALTTFNLTRNNFQGSSFPLLLDWFGKF